MLYPADAVVSVVPDTEIYHVSRTHDIRDHAVVKVVDIDCFFDADGIATGAGLFRKMKNEEQTLCQVLAPFQDFETQRKFIFTDIKAAFIEEYASVNWFR